MNGSGFSEAGHAHVFADPKPLDLRGKFSAKWPVSEQNKMLRSRHESERGNQGPEILLRHDKPVDAEYKRARLGSVSLN
jgi:hypothetical protein